MYSHPIFNFDCSRDLLWLDSLMHVGPNYREVTGSTPGHSTIR